MKNFLNFLLHDNKTIRDALQALDRLAGNKSMTLFVIDGKNRIKGTLTNGDIRRALIKGGQLEDKLIDVMNENFYYLDICDVNLNNIKECRKKGITLLPILNSDRTIVEIYDLSKRKTVLPIDAVLMAGGKGERLRPLTEKIPKPLLKVGDKCIIDHNVDRLIESGVDNINVTVNYLKEQIEEHYREKRDNIQIRCVREPRFLGTIGSVMLIETLINDAVLVMNSDLFTNINFEEFYLHFLDEEADMSVAVIPYSVNIPYGIFELEGSRILGIKEKPKYNYYANSGIYLIKRKLLNLIPKDTYFDATDCIEMLIANNYKVARFPLVGYWIDIGKHEDYRKAQDFIKYL